MKKLLTTSAIVLVFCSYSFAQNPVVEKALKDRHRKENEAKADKVVADSTKKTIQVTPKVSSSSSRKKCCSKSCCSNDKKKSS